LHPTWTHDHSAADWRLAAAARAAMAGPPLADHLPAAPDRALCHPGGVGHCPIVKVSMNRLGMLPDMACYYDAAGASLPLAATARSINSWMRSTISTGLACSPSSSSALSYSCSMAASITASSGVDAT